MAVKHVVEYYTKVTADYLEMMDTLKEMEKAFNDSVVSSEKLENVREATNKVKENYMTLSWIMHLLNQPQRDSKKARYERQESGKMKRIDPTNSRTPSKILEENKKELEHLKTLV